MRPDLLGQTYISKKTKNKKQANLKMDMTPSPSSVFRRPHCKESFLICNLILVLSFECTAAFTVLSKKKKK